MFRKQGAGKQEVGEDGWQSAQARPRGTVQNGLC